MISWNVSEDLQWKHELANHFCLRFLSKFINWASFDDVKYNNLVPGVIIICDNTGFNYIDVVNNTLKHYNINSYFNVKEYKYSIQINLKKEYINKIDELKTLLKIRNIL